MRIIFISIFANFLSLDLLSPEFQFAFTNKRIMVVLFDRFASTFILGSYDCFEAVQLYRE